MTPAAKKAETVSNAETLQATVDASMNVYQRVLTVMKSVGYVQKEGKAPDKIGGYAFVKHDDVVSKTRPHIVAAGLVLVPSVGQHHTEARTDRNGNSVTLTVIELVTQVVNVDDPDDRFSIISWGYGIDAGDKGIGKAVTYAFKYAVLKLFYLETGDDVESDSFELAAPTPYKLPEAPEKPAEEPQAPAKASTPPKDATPPKAAEKPLTSEIHEMAADYLAKHLGEGWTDKRNAFLAVQFPDRQWESLTQDELRAVMLWGNGQSKLDEIIAKDGIEDDMMGFMVGWAKPGESNRYALSAAEIKNLLEHIEITDEQPTQEVLTNGE